MPTLVIEGDPGRLATLERLCLLAGLSCDAGAAFAAAWDESRHPRAGDGKFAPAAGVSGSTMPAGEPQGHDGGAAVTDETLENWSFADSLRGVDPADLDAPVKGYRLQDGKKEMPKESSSHWTGDEGNTMGGSSAYANAANVIGDMLFGEEESVTGENYTKNIEEEGGEPQLWLLTSDADAEDAPGAELVVPEARPAGKFSRRQVFEALKGAMAEDHPDAAQYEDHTEEWAIEADLDDFNVAFPKWHRYADEAVELLRTRLREAAGRA